MSIYQKRWSSCGSGTTPTASSNGLLSSGVEPSTVGTSWNSVRWNKPSTSYRDRLASRFETNKSDLASMYIPQSRASSSRFSSSAAKNAADIASIGPSVSARASRFDSLSMPNREKYRSEARDLINKWSSRERTTSVGNQTSGGANSNSISSVYRSSYEPRTSSLTTKSTTPSYRSTTSLTPTRTSEIMSRYSSDRNSVLSPSPTPISLHTTPKADRPWRQRLAESSRIRSTLGDDYRSRQPSTETSSYFSPSTRFTTSTYPTTTYTKRSTVAEIPPLKNAVERQKSSSIIRESSKERDVVRKKSVRERTARRASRQNSQQQSSSDEELTEEQKKLRIRSRSNSAARLRKLRKKSEILDGVQYKVTAAEIEKEMKTSLQSLQSLSHYETGAEDGSIVAVPMGQSVPPESEGFQSCAASPLVPTISRSSSKNGVVKNQVIKSPSLIEVLGVSKEDVADELTDLDALEEEDNDESQYSAVAHFKPKKRARPVPGMWKSTTSENEEFISRNKSFHKSDAIGEVEMIMAILKTIEKIEKSLKIGDGKEKEKKVVKKKVIVTKRKKSSPIVLEVKEPVVAENKTPNEVAKPKTEVKPKTLVESKIGVKLKEESKPKITEAKPKEEPKPKTAEMKSKVSELKPKEEVKPKVVESKSKEESKPKVAEVTKKSVVVTKEPAKKLEKTPEEPKKEPEPPKKIPMVTKEITKYFTPRNKTTFLRAEISKPIPNHRNIGLRCRCTTDLKIAISEHYRRKARQERATVLVDTPIEGKNQARLKLKIRVPTPPPPSLPNIPDIMQSYMISESATEESAFSRSCSRQSDTRASIILDEMRNREADVEWIIKDGEEISDDLILPDQSILEQYVNRKRRRLRPSSICSSRGYESSNCASPCPSTVSELCLPSSVIVHEARKRAPNSAEPTVQMTSTPKGFTRNPPIAAIKPVPFEAPKTLFEKMIQDQANRNKSKNEKSAENETRDPSPHRRGSSQDEGMSSSISSQFAAAAAANSAHGQVRYAAHIPLNRNDSTTSGRVSTTSMDSQQSGALDVASKNIDHVIDQARHRHHQHRNKFKEAIDYLDQIFEDLKKECDVEEKNNNTSPIKSPKTRTVPTVKQSETAAPIVQTATTTAAPKKKIVVKPVAVRAKPKELVKQNSSPVEVVIPVRKISAEASEEPNIAETIVLKKTDKMDFTRRWLQDDLGSLAHLPPANIAPHISYYQDFDEHSLGSCSAEVAAYNTTKDRKAAARKTSDNPRPFRPQPVYGLSSDPPAPSKSNNTLPRVTSTDEMRRSGSQDPYSSLTLRSMRSEGGDRENVSPSAFQSFNRGGGSMRSSLRSLPDHSPVRQRLPTKPDPLLSIDQLVAELELNTDHQPFSQIEKRRSFPTSFVAKPVMNEYERPRYRVMEPKTSQSSQIQKAAYRPKPQYSLEETSRHPHQNLYKQNTLGNNAFETINQEKINPSRVEAMHNMFEKGTAPTAWKKMSPPQEAQYATLHSYSPPTINNNSNYPSQMHPISNSSNNNSNVRYAEYTPQVPTSQPPQRPPGSANSSQGGYYSSNSSGVGSNYPHVTNPNTARRSLVIDQQSISSRVPSVDEDDDGFYDNIGIYDDRRFSRGSELEASSSFRLPPSSSSSTNPSGTKHRIGSFLRKIGHAATSNRPPGSAASLLSLNKLSGNETVMKPVGGLMKSNSLSTEPWKKQVMREQTPKGLGARLKNTIFGGSRKRLDS